MKKVVQLALIGLASLAFVSCKKDIPSPDPGSDKCNLCELTEAAAKISYGELGSFTPTLFDENSYKVAKKTTLADGAFIETLNFNLNNGNHVIAQAINVDLNKVSIEAGTKNDSVGSISKATPYDMLTAYEKKHEGKTVYAAVNADFFGSFPVNAFVKNGTIIKESHNDNGVYDYKDPAADLPASMPMLFGISSSGKQAQIGPSVDGKTVKETVQTRFIYEIAFLDEPDLNSTSKITYDRVDLNESTTGKTTINIIDNKRVTLRDGKLLKIERSHLKSGVVKHGKILEIRDAHKEEELDADSNYLYVMIPENVEIEAKVGQYVAYYNSSEGEKWQHYETVLGARQALVLDGNIASTVTKENSNGAQTTDIPRTSVGIKPDGTVVVFSIEALRYGHKSTSESDSYGVNLPELAELMRYYGCAMGANFDGGGSSQLLVKEPNKELAVWTRSSDFGTYTLNESRPVINTLLVVEK